MTSPPFPKNRPGDAVQNLPTFNAIKTRVERQRDFLSNSDAPAVEDAMTEVWVLIAETRILFGCPADDWQVPDPMQYLDPFPRDHERWAYYSPQRRKLAVLVDGTPCDVVTAGLHRMNRAVQLLGDVQKLTTADRVPLRDEFLNIAGGSWAIKAPNKTDCSIATTTAVVVTERRRLDTLVQQGGEIFRAAQKEYQRQSMKRIPFFRDFRLARQMAKCAVERGIWEAKPLLEWMQQ